MAGDIADVRPGHHLCSLVETDDEQRAVLTPFLRQGLDRGEKVVYVADAHETAKGLAWLKDDGLDAEPHRSRGQLAVVGRDQTTLRDGLFDPVAMIGLVRSEVEAATAAGFPAVRIAEDRSWAVPGLPSPVRLMEFETLLDGYVRGAPCAALCVYDRRRFDAGMLLEVLPAHPWVAMGAELCDNPRYMPADDLPSAQRPAAELRRWLHGLLERKHAEDALAQERFLMQTLMNNVPDAIYFKDRDSRFIRVNHALAALFGLSDPAEAVGKSDFDFFAEEHARQAYDDEQAIIERGRPLTKEERETWVDRPDTWVSSTKVPMRDADGNPVGTFGISRDITAHKRAEAAGERLIGELQEEAVAVRLMSELLPRCASCGKTRDDADYLKRVEHFIREHAELDFSRGLCLACAQAQGRGGAPAGGAKLSPS